MFVLVGRNLTNMALLGIQYVEKRKLDTGIDAQKSFYYCIIAMRNRCYCLK